MTVFNISFFVSTERASVIEQLRELPLKDRFWGAKKRESYLNLPKNTM